MRIRKAVFPVAGMGTRFLPATKAMPKEMLTVVDRPLIQHVVDDLREPGRVPLQRRERVVGSGAGTRIECRIPGADCNPYLALAASLASGLEGIKKQISPPEAFVGDIYAAKDLPRVPYSLKDAVDAFAKSDFAKRAFGEDVVEHYSHFYRTEAAAYDKAVTDWERARYFERI